MVRPQKHRLLPFIFLAGLLSSCSNVPPRIAGLYSQLALVNNLSERAVYEQLSLFVQPDSESRLSDIANVYVINDSAGLYWALNPDTWEKRGGEGQFWIGSNDLVMPDGSPMPRGEYRVVMTDLAGARAETSFVLDQARTPASELVFPSLKISGSEISVSSPARSAEVTVLDPAGSFSARREVSAGQVSIDRIIGRPPEPGRRLDLYVNAYDQQHRLVLLTGPYAY